MKLRYSPDADELVSKAEHYLILEKVKLADINNQRVFKIEYTEKKMLARLHNRQLFYISDLFDSTIILS